MDLPTTLLHRLTALHVRIADVDENFVRGSGPGGQKINKTSSTVQLRHRPTGVEVRCQDGRSQSANRETAWTELCVKLELRALKTRAAARAEREKERRRNRPKSARAKARQVADKRHRSQVKSGRGRVSD